MLQVCSRTKKEPDCRAARQHYLSSLTSDRLLSEKYGVDCPLFDEGRDGFPPPPTDIPPGPFLGANPAFQM